jgi:hypothetical protein
MASNTPKKNRTEETVALQKLHDGLVKHGQAIPSLVIAGVPVTTADAEARLQARIDAGKAVQATRGTWQNAVKLDKDGQLQSKSFLSGLKQTLLVVFAGQIDVLTDFGLTPRKPAVVSPEKKAAAVAKAKATREMRHTMGPKQKAQIKAPTAAPTPAPAAAPATPAATTTPHPLP